MRIHYSFDKIKNPVVTTKKFDGVHVENLVKIKRLKSLALIDNTEPSVQIYVAEDFDTLAFEYVELYFYKNIKLLIDDLKFINDNDIIKAIKKINKLIF